MRHIGIALLAIALAGCAAPKPKRPPPKIEAAPICYSDAQCSAMWSEALIQLQNVSGMRLQTATDSFAQTFNPTSFDRLGGMARKMPNPDGSTTIEAQFTCRYECNNLQYSGLNLFILNVNLAGSRFAPSQPPSSAKPQPAPPAAAPSKAQYQQQQLDQLMQQNLPYEEYMKRYKAIMGNQ